MQKGGSGHHEENRSIHYGNEKARETALKQQRHKAFVCDFKGGERANKDAVEYIAEKYNIKEPIPGGDRVGQENTEKV